MIFYFVLCCSLSLILKSLLKYLVLFGRFFIREWVNKKLTETSGMGRLTEWWSLECNEATFQIFWETLRPFLGGYSVSPQDNLPLSCMRSKGQLWPLLRTFWRLGSRGKGRKQRKRRWQNSPVHTCFAFSIASTFHSSPFAVFLNKRVSGSISP